MRNHLTRQFPSATTLVCRTLLQSKDPIKLVSVYEKSVLNLYSSYSRSGMPQNNEFQLIKILKAILGKSPVDPFFSPRTRKMRYVFATVLFAGSLYYAFNFMTQKNLEGAAFIRQTLINLRLDPKVEEWIGSPIELIPGSYEGYLNTFEAFADIHFNIRGPLGIIKVHAVGDRDCYRWRTTKLEIVDAINGKNYIIYELVK